MITFAALIIIAVSSSVFIICKQLCPFKETMQKQNVKKTVQRLWPSAKLNLNK